MDFILITVLFYPNVGAEGGMQIPFQTTIGQGYHPLFSGLGRIWNAEK